MADKLIMEYQATTLAVMDELFDSAQNAPIVLIGRSNFTDQKLRNAGTRMNIN